jgi:hypothetical protein
MSDKIEHEPIISTDLAGQEIRERLLQTAKTRILVIEFNDLVEATALASSIAPGIFGARR